MTKIAETRGEALGQAGAARDELHRTKTEVAELKGEVARLRDELVKSQEKLDELGRTVWSKLSADSKERLQSARLTA